MSEKNPFENTGDKPSSSPPQNPFQAPVARVEDVSWDASTGSLRAEPRRIDAGQGVSWWGGGWNLFKGAIGTWIGITIIMLALNMVSALIPFLGNFISSLLWSVLVAGIMLGCRSLDRGEELRVGHLFEGFNQKFGQLLLVGLIYTGGLVLLFMVVGIIVFVGVLLSGVTASISGFEDMFVNAFPVILFGFLIAFALIVPLAMALWFTPALVVFHDLSPVSAMKMSFVGCLRNWQPFLVYILIWIGLTIVAILPFGLGFLVFIPCMMGSMYVSYKDIFLE